MKFNYQEIQLPVKEVIPQVQKELVNNNTLILKAPPGAGKSTLVPLALMDEPWLQGQKVLMLEPRRLAAKTIAGRMAELLGEKVGESVGYRIRFENKTSDQTKLEVLTEGVLTRMLQQDNGLEGVGLVLFDEFHERSIHADTAMALCRESQNVLRPDLRMVIMSATLEKDQLSKVLKAPVIESQGKQFPVSTHYVGECDLKLLPELMSRAIKKALEENSGDLLAFLPGQGEIKKCEELLKRSVKGVVVHPLYGQLSGGKQMSAILPDKEGKRKVVLSTNIAETSLTIGGVKIVVDSGFERVAVFDPNSGLTRLETVKISKNSAVQRTGRAGRLSEGVCYRMWTLADHNRMEEHSIPEIEKADLCPLMLDLAQWGITDPGQLTWVTPPPIGHVASAIEILHQLDALENGKITNHGRELYKLPTHPRIAHMLLWAEENNQLALGTDVASLLEERDPLPNDSGIDINLRIEALRRFRRDKVGGGHLARIEKIAAQYRKMFSIESDNGAFDDFETGILLAHAYPERIACARPGNNAQFQMANGRIAAAGHKDDLAHEPWLAVAQVNDRHGVGKIFMASPLDPRDLSSMVKTREVITWNTQEGGLIATQNLGIGSIVLQSKPLANPNEQKVVEAISQAIEKDGVTLLNWNDEIEQWQNRVLTLRKWYPEKGWPDVSTNQLLSNNMEWLSPYLTTIKKNADLKKINLLEVLEYSIDAEKRRQLESLTPTKIKVPSGSLIPVKYQASGSSPILEVRLQECFGMQNTPRVNNGKEPVLMHLLSPGFKIVQITGDMESFWKEAYFEVRKDLRIRYKKHSWPEDPMAAEAVKGAKRKSQ